LVCLLVPSILNLNQFENEFVEILGVIEINAIVYYNLVISQGFQWVRCLPTVQSN